MQINDKGQAYHPMVDEQRIRLFKVELLLQLTSYHYPYSLFPSPAHLLKSLVSPVLSPCHQFLLSFSKLNISRRGCLFDCLLAFQLTHTSFCVGVMNFGLAERIEWDRKYGIDLF